ncbi:sorting nexin-16 isoform X2 [Patella vulgata]|uniref:sorting nexin-16 isoform X2 n=1 Tax=Patella vulgata TaxID=6465 RepID=UPI0024A979F4|nr:sorting nexin-16 isoform X2 [Patella vulgata]
MNAEEFLSLELNIDPIDSHLILDKMENDRYEDEASDRRDGVESSDRCDEDGSSDRRDTEEEPDSPLVPKQLTSTPIKVIEDENETPREFDPYNNTDQFDDGDETGSNSASLYSSPSHQDIPTITITPESDPIEPDQLRVPILGHEVMESRSKFTVYKIEIERDGFDKWFVFRRYNDFYQLHEKLKEIFPNFRLALPPRRWFRSNYDKEFLEERTLGLQAFLNNITGHGDICNCKCVRDFFCFDDPPGPHDSLEESRALCENLEETVYNLRKELSEKEEEVEILQEELSLYKNQVEILSRELSHLTATDKSDTEDTKQDKVSPSTGINRIPFKNKISVPIVSTDVYSS